MDSATRIDVMLHRLSLKGLLLENDVLTARSFIDGIYTVAIVLLDKSFSNNQDETAYE